MSSIDVCTRYRSLIPSVTLRHTSEPKTRDILNDITKRQPILEPRTAYGPINSLLTHHLISQFLSAPTLTKHCTFINKAVADVCSQKAFNKRIGGYLTSSRGVNFFCDALFRKLSSRIVFYCYVNTIFEKCREYFRMRIIRLRAHIVGRNPSDDDYQVHERRIIERYVNAYISYGSGISGAFFSPGENDSFTYNRTALVRTRQHNAYMFRTSAVTASNLTSPANFLRRLTQN